MLKVDETKVSEYENQITSINESLSKIDSYHEELGTILNSHKWQGTAREAFASVKVTSEEYVANLEADYEKLKEEINTLMANVDSFATKSTVVQELSD